MRFPTIPAVERAGLDRLATLTEDQIRQLCRVLSNALIVLDRDLFISRLEPVPGASPEDLQQITWSLMFLHSYLAATTDISVDEFVSDVCAAVAEGGVEQSRVEDLKKVLPPLLGIDALRLRAKAVDLQVDHARVFQNARVLTDVRPVFGVESTDDVRGVLVFHTLKVQYFEDEGAKELYVVLDDRDVDELSNSLERARRKARGIRALLQAKAQVDDFADTTIRQG
ncbi:MAG TPA: hypothetical protein VKG25_13370 [Bryobacteraceae bacterium]|nr:hypothetical protein [Bryobacteraceae bacterium]